jgi:hypothetical protein
MAPGCAGFGVCYGPPSGAGTIVSSAEENEMLSPLAARQATNLAVRVPSGAPFGLLVITLLVDNSPTALSCTISSGLTCGSSASVPIPAGSRLVMELRNLGGFVPTLLYGFEL